jgi:anti-repressor protein
VEYLSVLEGSIVMSSREIAELTGKDIGNIHRDIKAQLVVGLYGADIEDDSNLNHIDIKGVFVNHDKRGYIKEILLNRYHSDILVSGYEVKYRAAIVRRWHELENKVALPDFTNPAVAARAWANEFEARLKAETQIEQDRPKVEFAMAVRNMQGACKIGDFAKTLGTGRTRFFRWLRERGVLMANRLPYQQFIDRGFFVVIEQVPYTDSKGKEHPAFTTMVTGAGQIWLERKYRDFFRSNTEAA